MDAPEISVIIPTRNRWPLLSRRALRAALMQENVSYEVIVVDDGSTDETVERLGNIEGATLRVLRNDRPGRVARARNAGIAEARGEWLAFLDDDDAWSPYKLASQIEAVRAARADFTYASVVTVDDDGRVLHTTPAPSADGLRESLIAACVIPAGPSNVLARTAIVRELGGFDDRFRNLEDWDLWIRLAWAGEGVAVPEVLVAYLEHGDAKSLTGPREAFAELADLERKHRDLTDANGLTFDRVAYSHYVAWLQLRRRRHASAARTYLRSAVGNRRLRDVVPAARFGARALVPARRSFGQTTDPGSDSRPPWLEAYP